MITRESTNKVVFNSDDPERQLVVSESLIEETKLFGITFLTKRKYIDQEFQNKKSGGTVGFR
jgi:hypothetical protein